MAYDQRKQDLANILRTLCKREGMDIVEAEGCPDDLHMLIELPAQKA